ncbi:hypothetical protein [Arcobacter arenosus]|uniref:hypothetical protein n=1 Tax=Arcobacter arenosus TaxID=2576037 RepID=UPI003BA93FF5
MSIFTAPFKDPNYVYLNQKEHDLINPNKQQGCNTLGDRYCRVCGRPLKYGNQQLCHRCKANLIRGNLFHDYTGSLTIEGDEWKRFYPYVTNYIVNEIDAIMEGRFKTKRYKAKMAKLLYIMDKYIKANGDIYPDVCYRRLRYYADNKRDGLQKTLQKGKKIFSKLLYYKFK